MKKLKTTWYTILLLMYASVLLLVTSSCGEDEPQPEFNLDTFEGVIASGGSSETFDLTEVETKVEVEAPTDSTLAGSDWICKTERVSIEKGNGKFPSFNPNANVVYPGNLLQGNSLENGTPAVINVERAGGVISHNINAGNIDPSADVPKMTKSGVQDAISELIGNADGVKVPANFSFQYFSVQSEKEMAFKLGLKVSTMASKFEGRMSFNKSREFNQYIVRLTQEFYTLSWDLPSGFDAYFAPSVQPSDLTRFIGPGNPATYISDVTYGRIFYMLIESTSTSQEMEAAINGSFKGLTKVEGSAEASSVSNLSNMKVQVIALGGDSDATFNTIGETDIGVIVDELAKAGDINTGKPLSYIVRDMFDDRIVAVKLNTEYDIVSCQPAGPGNLDFLPRQILNTSIGTPYTVQTGDMNNDGDMDLVLNYTETDKNETQIAYANGDGTFDLSSVITHPAFPEGLGWTSFNFQLGDFNGDGFGDIVWNSISTGSNYVYLANSNGDGTFTFGDQLLTNGGGWEVYKLLIDDFDGDLKDDLAWNALTPSSNRTYIMRSTEGLPNNTMDVTTFSSNWSPYRAFTGSFDSDARTDFAFRRYSDNAAIHIALTDGNGILSTRGTELENGWLDYNWTLIGDIDGDKLDDVVIPNIKAPLVNVLISNGDKTVKNRITTNLMSSDKYGDYAKVNTYLADFNADGKMDFLWNTLDGNGNTSRIGLGTVDGKFNFSSVKQYHPDFEEDWLQFGNILYPGDLNGDEKTDLVWVEPARDMKVYVGLAK